jgi:mannitol/fructose-specific phosphotransferase system IIA component (Ntr-type)
MDVALVTKTEAKVLVLLADDKKSSDTKAKALSKLVSKLQKPYTTGASLRNAIHATIMREAMGVLVG